MNIHKIKDEDIITIKPWIEWNNLETIEHPRVIYSHINELADIIRKTPQPFVFISTYNGDGGIHEYDHELYYRIGCSDTIHALTPLPKGNYHIFSTNVNILPHPNVTCLPYGVGAVKRCPCNKDILCYTRFTCRTYQRVRVPTRQFCESQDFITCDFLNPPNKMLVGMQPYQTEETLARYYDGLNRSKFTICPQGNGPCTYRVWEALYCNCIPIVIDRPIYRNFMDLPFVRVDHLYEITENFLNEEYERIINTKWNLDKLKLSYYNKLFKSKVDELLT